jgi:hypothetical protein
MEQPRLTLADTIAADAERASFGLSLAAAGDPVGNGLVTSLARTGRQRHRLVAPAERYRQ